MHRPEKIFDPLRGRWVTAAPEERIRQAVIAWMLEKGRYPRSLLCVEKRLTHLESMPFDLQYPGSEAERHLPRRFDLLCLRRVGAMLKPLLLVECKALKISSRAKKQVLDYNYFVKAPAVALACRDGCAFCALFECHHEEKDPMRQEHLPSWQKGLPTYLALQDWLTENDAGD